MVVRRVKARLAAGERAFWVVPRIEAEDAEESESDGGHEAAEQAHARLSSVMGVHGVELVHGRLAREERLARVERFRSGASRLLVGTTVVEVGVDVPEATLLVIDGAERFGLAQLHQLRGRVGRSEAQSHCVLIAGGSGAERCRALAASADGFEIAEEDLRRRGMGELAGLRQSGEAGDEFTTDPRLHLFARDAVVDERVRDHYLETQNST
jgi:ATP-dependent DNA helicase RecG